MIEYDDDRRFDEIRNDVGRLQSLVTLCMDMHVETDRLVLQHPDIRVTMLNGDVSRHEQRVEFLATPLKYEGNKAWRRRLSQKNLVSLEELGGVSAVARWLERSKRFERALDSLMSAGRARQMYVENRFLNIAGAAESFHRSVYGGTYMDPPEFSKLIEEYIKITPDEHREWLVNRIGYANDWPLRKRLKDLADRASGAIEPLIGNKRRWSNLVSGVRNNLTHLGQEPSPFGSGDLHFLTKSVYAAVRVCMLLEAGASLDVLSEKSEASNVYWYRERLKDAMGAITGALKS
ncbi:HEPN domain-containing protein [Amycolatopsis magusensis]|uniref:Apea-like HEPN domain-containing protein n=1 Tax=Amycolatopsis magusensis TaxID=882444 RepID=A0ABS4PS44_9PSEU|nr:hypothetical protein [Amycolatopsis magusensis]